MNNPIQCCGTVYAHQHTWPQQPALPPLPDYQTYLPYPYAMRAPPSLTTLPTSLRSAAPEPSTLPSPAQFDRILNDYILSLSPKKRDKALISRKRCENIMRVLQDPKCTTIESAQFRHWAKKMFELGQLVDGTVCVLHRDREELRPVAVREELYEVLTTCHVQAQHGGRDKTALRVKQSWSWVPKELIARFVRYCPSCSLRRASPSKARQQKIKREEEDHMLRMEDPASPPSPSSPHSPGEKVQDRQQAQDYSYPTPANSPTATTAAAYATAASAASHPAHLLMPNTQVPPEHQWAAAQYWDSNPYE